MPEQLADKLWNYASILDPKTREQAHETASMDFIYPHLALMPDAHLGMGATVGSVIPTRNAIMPAAVGVDIGCGMMAVKTQFNVRDLDHQGLSARTLREDIENVIPLGKGVNNTTTYNAGTMRRQTELASMRGSVSASKIMPTWDLQLGTLGGGNHFIEVSADEDGAVWLFLHSGSRGVGNKLATHHIKIALAACRKWQARLPNPDLAFLPQGTQEFDDYLRDLHWAQRFAFLNREEMMERVRNAFGQWVGDAVIPQDTVNCHHNYTSHENVFGVDVWLSRKGAIDANEGVRGLIPGSMGASSYVVTGKGDRLSLNSAPHGAGRNFSRSKAKEKFSRTDLEVRMREAGIEYNADKDFRDEHPLAYKDIDVVMHDAEPLVTVDHVLHQLINVKGE